jgi:hypothetical protein
MSASAIGPTHRSLPHFMLHRNIGWAAAFGRHATRKLVHRAAAAFADSPIGLSYASKVALS